MLCYSKYVFLLLLMSCSGAELSDSGRYGVVPGDTANSEKIDAAAGNQPSPPPTAPAETQFAPQPEGPEIGLPETAVVPVAVGGASLTCSLVENAPDDAKCVASSTDGKPLNFTVANAYAMYGQSMVWRLVSFRPIPGTSDSWIVSLPYGARNRSVGIILSDVSQSIMADWIINDTNKPANLALDGGFEENVLDHTTPDTLLQSQFLPPERQTAWKALNTTTPDCRSVIEIQSIATITELSAIEGGQWTELDASCNANYFVPGNNVSLYQDLTLQVDHLYQISFYYKVRSGGITAQGFRAAFGSQTLVTRTVTEADWTQMSFVVTASEAKARLAFTEIGDPVDGRGTLLDDVVVIDLGDSKTVLENVKDRREGRRGRYTPPAPPPSSPAPALAPPPAPPVPPSSSAP